MGLMANATPVRCGRHYWEDKPGSSPTVTFAPEFGGAGEIDSPIEMGLSASMVHGCAVKVRARESGEDFDRFREVYKLADMVIDLIQTAGTGRIVWGGLSDGSPTNTDAYGVELVFSFTFQRDIPHNARRWSLPAADADTDLASPHPPPGTPGVVDTVIPTTIPVT